MKQYVCPRCGTPAAGASECSACGLDLDAQPDLPTRAEYEAGGIAAVEEQHAREVGLASDQYADLGTRVFADIADTAIVVVVAVLAGIVAAVAAGSDGGTVVGGVLLLGVLLYAPLMVAFNAGQTVAKRRAGVRVQRQGGGPVGFGRAFLREAVAKTLIPGLVDFLVANNHERRHSVHDVVAGTEVVRAQPGSTSTS
jgi:uncharacterized RDD family membrane protein YckC